MYEVLPVPASRTRLANLISNIFNPFALSLLGVVLISIKSTGSILDALRWSAVFIAICMVPVYLFIAHYVRTGHLDSFFSNSQQQRTRIYLVGGFFAGVALVTLELLKAPDKLVAILLAAFVSSVLFMLVNLLWKISVHTAFATAFVTLAALLYGWIASPLVLLVPAMAWSRIELKQHSLAQTAGGAILATLTLLVVFWLSGLLRAT